MIRRYLVWVGTTLLAFIAAGALLCLGYVCRSEESFWPDEKFTVERWNATPSEQRHVLARDLIQSRILNGMNKSEVISMLGEPDSGRMNDGISYRDNISYVLKSGSISISYNAVWFLRILFDPGTGAVQQYMIAGD